MVDKDAPAASRVRAAHSVLDLAAKALELEDIEVRLHRLEQVEKDGNAPALRPKIEKAA